MKPQQMVNTIYDKEYNFLVKERNKKIQMYITHTLVYVFNISLHKNFRLDLLISNKTFFSC